MSLGSLGALNVLLSADTTAFTSAMEKAAYVADRNLAKIALRNKISFAAISTAAVAASTALSVSVKKAIDSADQLGKMSQSVGFTVEQLSGLAYAAKLSDVELDGLKTSFQKFNKAIYDGSRGLKEQQDAFKALGVSTVDAGGKIRNNYDLFLDSAEALSKMQSGAEKTALAMVLFGKSGATMLPLLNGGREGIKQLTDEAAKFGVVISGETAAAAEKFNDNMSRIASVSQGLINSFTSGLIPSLADVIDNISGSAEALEKFKIAGESVAGVIIALTNTGLTLWQTFSSVIDSVRTGADMLLDFPLNRFKEMADTGADYAQRQGDQWAALAVTLEKNWAAFNGVTQAGAASTQKTIEDVAESTNTFNKNQEEGAKLTETLRSSTEKYNDEMQRYKELLEAGAISQETFERAAAKSKDTLDKSTETTSKLQGAAKDLGFTFQSAFEDAILEGKQLSEVLMSLLKDIERIVIRKAITEPISNWIGAMIPSFGGGAGAAAAIKSAHGNVFSGGSVVPFASGGLITRPSLFPMANGGVGLAGEAGTEAIMPLFRGSNGDLGVKGAGGRGVEINVYAPPGSKVSQNQQSKGDMDQINIMIDEAAAGAVKNPSSKTYRALKSSFGLRQTLTPR